MKVLYVGDVSAGSTAAMRARTMESLGHEIVRFDPVSCLKSNSRIMRAIRFRFPGGPWARKANSEFVRIASASQPELIWVDKGLSLRRQTLSQARHACGAQLVHYNPDDPFGSFRRGWSVFLDALPEYDVHLVMRDVNIEEYRQAGARRVRRWHWAFDPQTHHPCNIDAQQRKAFGGTVGFIGDYEKDRADQIAHLASNGISVRIWGPNWHHFSNPGPNVQIEGRGLWDEEYGLALNAFDIMLGFLRKGNRDLSTQRSIEIPASAAFMLAERTQEHRTLFEEGKEAEYFASPAELLQKVRYYLEHPEERLRIANAGHQRCLSSGYSYSERLRQCLADIREKAMK